jgi:hypothetical protein
MNRSSTTRVAIVCVILGLRVQALVAQGAAPGAAMSHEQSAPAANRPFDGVPTTVALVDRALGAEPYTIVRNPKGTHGDVIVMNAASANGSLLVQAVLELAALRERHGDTSAASVTARAHGLHIPVRWESTEVPHADRLIDRLRSVRATHLAGVGLARSTVVYLPGRSRRHAKHR